MSARRRLAVLMPGALLIAFAAVAAAEEDAPDPAFLEYLGMWDRSDDEWLVLEDDSQTLAPAADDAPEPAPKSTDLTETIR